VVKKTYKGTCANMWGKKIEPPVVYDYDVSEYETPAELVEAKDELSADEQVKARNVTRKNNARNAAQLVALKAAGFEAPTLETDVALRLKTLVDVLVANGDTEEAATVQAKTILGIKE